MYSISDENKKRISENVGLPFEKLTQMTSDEITAYIEKKTGKKMEFSKSSAMHTGSGHDSVLIDNDKITTMEEFSKKIDKAVSYQKQPKKKHKTIIL